MTDFLLTIIFNLIWFTIIFTLIAIGLVLPVAIIMWLMKLSGGVGVYIAIIYTAILSYFVWS